MSTAVTQRAGGPEPISSDRVRWRVCVWGRGNWACGVLFRESPPLEWGNPSFSLSGTRAITHFPVSARRIAFELRSQLVALNALCMTQHCANKHRGKQHGPSHTSMWVYEGGHKPNAYTMRPGKVRWRFLLVAPQESTATIKALMFSVLVFPVNH